MEVRPLCLFIRGRKETLPRPPLRAHRPYAPHCVGPLRVGPPRPETLTMITEMSATAGVGEEVTSPDKSGAGTCKGLTPADFVYDNGQILLELLRGRADVEDRRRFISSLRRLHGGDEASEES